MASRPGFATGRSPEIPLRKLIVIANPQYVRNLIQAGAFDGIDDEHTYWLPGDIKMDRPPVRGKVLDPIALPKLRWDTYTHLRQLMLASYRKPLGHAADQARASCGQVGGPRQARHVVEHAA